MEARTPSRPNLGVSGRVGEGDGGVRHFAEPFREIAVKLTEESQEAFRHFWGRGGFRISSR